MYQWTDGEVSHVVKLAFRSLRSVAPSLAASHCGRLIETLAHELSASAWHAQTIQSDAIAEGWRMPWRTIATDGRYDWSGFCPLDYYASQLRCMYDASLQTGTAKEEIAYRTCQLGRTELLYAAQQRSGEIATTYHVLAWLEVQPRGTCGCVEFLKPMSEGPFTVRDEALVRILSAELLAEPVEAATASEWPEPAELAELPRRQREVLMRLLTGSSVKEIAMDLGISPYTVNDYIKALYRRYQVSSRGELMAAMHGLRRPAVPK